jgi:UDP-N-acetylglucosamine 1-carboxyvinyltransferase
MLALMGEFGVTADRPSRRVLVLERRGARSAQAPYDLVRRMRAAFWCWRRCLARSVGARCPLPGRLRRIGARPIDLHLKALEALGADVNVEAGYIHARTQDAGLRGVRIVLSSPSVGATETASDGDGAGARRKRDPSTRRAIQKSPTSRSA